MITAAEVQETLRDLIAQFGPPNDSNTRLYSSVLKNALINDPREAGLLELSLDAQIPGRIYEHKNNPHIIDLLIQELISSHRIDSHAAEWIVKSWAKSMGMNVPSYQPTMEKMNHQPAYEHQSPPVKQLGYSEIEKYGQRSFQQSSPVLESNNLSSTESSNTKINSDRNFWLEKAHSLSQLGRHEEAIEAYNQALNIDPNNPTIWESMGFVLITLDRYEEALNAFEQLLNINPTVGAYTVKAMILHRLGKNIEATRIYAEVLKAHPDYTFAWINMGILFFDIGSYEPALKSFEKGCELDPESIEGWWNLGKTLCMLDRFDEALHVMNQVLNLDNKNFEASVMKGSLLFDLGRNEEAINAYNQALNIDPNYARGWVGLGNSLHALGRNEEAINAWNQALKIDPNNADALSKLNVAGKRKGGFFRGIFNR